MVEGLWEGRREFLTPPSSHCPYMCSEFQQATQSDSERLYQLMCHLARPGHPMNKFFWGNNKTLKVVPKKKVRCEVLQQNPMYDSAMHVYVYVHT